MMVGLGGDGEKTLGRWGFCLFPLYEEQEDQEVVMISTISSTFLLSFI